MSNAPPKRLPGEALLPSRQTVTPRDAELFQRHLAAFVPPGAFDIHAHLFPLGGWGFSFPPGYLATDDADVTLPAYHRFQRSWMGDRTPSAGLFFGFPTSRQVDVPVCNDFVAAQVANTLSRGLMLVRPDDDPATVEAMLAAKRFLGFKVYATFAVGRADYNNADLGEYLTPWMWELADARGLSIVLHMMKPRALDDASNQAELRAALRRWPNARLILAHAARGFCADHTLDGLRALAGFDNVYFDTSAVCESGALVAILKQFGPSRLLFGSDFPVCGMRGRCMSVADGFVWVMDNSLDWSASPYGQPTLVGLESLLALRQAARLADVTDAGVEAIFRGNAQSVLGLTT